MGGKGRRKGEAKKGKGGEGGEEEGWGQDEVIGMIMGGAQVQASEEEAALPEAPKTSSTIHDAPTPPCASSAAGAWADYEDDDGIPQQPVVRTVKMGLDEVRRMREGEDEALAEGELGVPGPGVIGSAVSSNGVPSSVWVGPSSGGGMSALERKEKECGIWRKRAEQLQIELQASQRDYSRAKALNSELQNRVDALLGCEAALHIVQGAREALEKENAHLKSRLAALQDSGLGLVGGDERGVSWGGVGAGGDCAPRLLGSRRLNQVVGVIVDPSSSSVLVNTSTQESDAEAPATILGSRRLGALANIFGLSQPGGDGTVGDSRGDADEIVT